MAIHVIPKALKTFAGLLLIAATWQLSQWLASFSCALKMSSQL